MGRAARDRVLDLLTRHKQTVLHRMDVSCTSAQTAAKPLTVVEIGSQHLRARQ